jgi:hypothetical protein
MSRWREVAESEGYYGGTGWCVEDVMGLVKAKDLGWKLSEEQAKDFLERNAGRIQDLACESGWEVISALLDMERGDFELTLQHDKIRQEGNDGE